MAFYGYTIGDADNSGTTAVGFDVYRFIIPVDCSSDDCDVELVGTLTGANFSGANGTDLEGLGTSPRIQRISAVSEGPGTGRRVNNLDEPALPPAPQTQNFTGVARVYSDTGSDFYVDASEVATQYIIQGDKSLGSVLYKTGASGTIGNTILSQVGTDSEFADGLAIYNVPVDRKVLNGQYTGEYWAIASDFATAGAGGDGDGEEIYIVDLDGPDILGNPLQLVNPDGTDFDVLTSANASGRPDPEGTDGFDSGLAFTPDGKRLIALTENGILYEITDYLDDLLAPTLGNGEATIKQLCALTLDGNPLPGSVPGTIEYEGLGIVSENAAGTPDFVAPFV